MNTEIDFVPAGGLGNRMKAMAAALRLARAVDARLNILWFQDWGLGCHFDQLFTLSEPWNDCLREATMTDKLLRDRPRRHNFYLPRLYQRCRYDLCIGEEEATRMMYEGQDLAALCRGRRVWLSSHVYFMGHDIPDDSFDTFHPIPKLQTEIERRLEKLEELGRLEKLEKPNIVGVHIRRTDNQRSITDSPTELFVERMRQEPSDTVFYLATDSEDEKRQLSQIFGPRLQYAPRQAERGTLQGMEDALVEMYLLARTRRILGSAASTYSMTAAAIGRVPLEILKN
jgi:hypothetical protein